MLPIVKISAPARLTGLLLLLVALGLIISPSIAVVLRHDVESGRYERLAADAEYLRAGCVTVVDARGNYTGVLIGTKHVLTVGHPIVGHLPIGASRGPVAIQIRIHGKEYRADYAFLHPQYDRVTNRGGADLAILRLSAEVSAAAAAASAKPTTIWVGGVQPGTRFVGVGQGKSGTGQQSDEPLPMGIYRGYENTIDFIYGADSPDLSHFRSDFDDGSENGNTLARVLFGSSKSDEEKPQKRQQAYRGRSSRRALPLEGSIAAGDSGSGIWIQQDSNNESGKVWHLAGIASYRYYSMYGAQAGYVNLSHPAVANWLGSVARDEEALFRLVNSG